MKFYCELFLCVLAVLWVEVSTNCSSLENLDLENVVEEGSVFYIDLHCTKYTCQNGQYSRETKREFVKKTAITSEKENKRTMSHEWTTLNRCSLPQCKDNIMPIMDNTKRYPDCCPVCPEISKNNSTARLFLSEN